MSTTTIARNLARASLGLVVAGAFFGLAGTAFADTSVAPTAAGHTWLASGQEGGQAGPPSGSAQPGSTSSAPTGSWESATAVLTDRLGKQTTVAADSFHYCSNVVGDDVTLSESQTVAFEKIDRLDVVHSDAVLTSEGKADLAVTLLDGQQLTGTVSANCDFSGDTSAGRFNIYPEKLKSVEFHRGADAAPAPSSESGPVGTAPQLQLTGSLSGKVTASSVTCTRLTDTSWSWLLEGSVDGNPLEITFNTNYFRGTIEYNASSITDEAGGLMTLNSGEVGVVSDGGTHGTFTIADDQQSGSVDADLRDDATNQQVHVKGSWRCS